MSGRKRSKQGDDVPRAPRVREDTIVAVATAAGRAAIAVVRVSGRDAVEICRRVIGAAAPWPPASRRATRCRIHDVDDPATLLDDGLVTLFPAPHSYTGETVIELGVHGGAYVPAAVMAAIVRAGARPAEPGEFTERAVLGGKLDLLRAEAIGDLIDARTRAMHRTALQQLSGALSRHLESLRAGVIELEALLAYDVDFPGEDDGDLPRRRVLGACDAAVAALDTLLATAPAAELARDGVTVVLAGPPNAGKSSLLNALVGESRVIVSDSPGTTRDAVDVLLEHDPWPLRLVDTAGLRDSADPVERLGIEVSARWLARADVVVACAETGASLRETMAAVARLSAAPVVCALTKCDLVPKGDKMPETDPAVISVSAACGTGLAALLVAVTNATRSAIALPDAETPVITRARHRMALECARAELAAFRDAWNAGALPAPVAAVHVHAAVAALDGLIGAVDVDDVLARVFSTFCVGK
ncbi:MAG: tRNA uridine-5-carboxymethylaminomethyl(34) synthesis GTPase MnmE [Gemmatimonadaceae bacterium]